MMRNWIVGVVCVGCMSCTSIGYVSRESLHPAELSFPPEIKVVAVADNTVSRDTLRQWGITLGLIEGNGKSTARQLAVRMADSDYFDEVILCDSSIRSGRYEELPVKLSQDMVKALTSDLKADMLVTVDGVVLRTWPDWNVVEEDSPYLAEGVSGELSAVISLYLPSRKEPLHFALGMQDTLFWVLSPALTERVMVEDAADWGAKLLQKYIVPQWVPENRFFYADGTVELRDAAVCVREEDWEGASRLWHKQYEAAKPRSKKRMYAAFNLALYQEMQGNVAEALKLLSEAGQTAKSGSRDAQLVKAYEKALSGKQMGLRKLDLQMDRFKNED